MKEYLTKKAEYEKQLNDKYASFDYDAEKDALFKLQRKQLERERTDGVSDLLARYAASTGMAGSSAAMSAARDTSSRYAGQIADALASAEQTAYERWRAERAALEAKMAENRSMAMDEAERRLALGDVSGYGELGYDTSAYEAKLERERRAEEAKLAAALASATGSGSGSGSGSKTTVSSDRGGNGMTKAEYEATRENLLKKIGTYERYRNDAVSDEEEANIRESIARLYRQLGSLDEAYYSKPRYVSDREIEDIMSVAEENAGIGEKTIVSYPEYLALARYYEKEGGEEYLARRGITFSRNY